MVTGLITKIFTFTGMLVVANTMAFTLFFAFDAKAISVSQSSIAMQQPANTQLDEQVETIEVVGERPLSYFRRNLIRKEDAFFSLMNDLVTETDFKVDCKAKEIHTFSRLKTRKCEAKFVSRIIGEVSQASLELSSSRNKLKNIPSSLETRQNVKKRQQEYIETMVTLINQSPELLAAYKELEAAKAMITAAKQQDNGNTVE